MKIIQKIRELDADQRNFQSKAGYFAAFERIAKTTTTKREAYEILEGEYERVFGHRKYAEYPNFRRYRLQFYSRQNYICME